VDVAAILVEDEDLSEWQLLVENTIGNQEVMAEPPQGGSILI